MKTSNLNRFIITVTSILCLGASAFAGPGVKYIMINGTMMEVTAITSDVTLSNGCKVCTKGAIISPKGHVTKLHDGDMVSATGVKMSPSALHAHGG
jgi:uncharacterized protein DUF6799